MHILLVGRKHIAKSEDIIASLEHLNHQVDFVLFPGFHYTQTSDSYETSIGKIPYIRSRSRKTYYLKNLFRINTLLFSHFRKKRYDILLAIDWFEGCILLIYKYIFSRRSKLVFYSYDFYFFDKVFSSRFIINLIDRFVAKHADEVWNVNDAIRHERDRQGITIKNVKLVPLGIRRKALLWIPNDTRHFLFVGNLKKGHNLIRLTQAFSLLVRENPAFHLTIIGQGNQEEILRNAIRSANIEDNVHMRGFSEEKAIIQEIQAGKYAFGVALYEKTREVACVDPGKIKDYLSWNLPILTTDTNSMAQEITRYRLGRVLASDDIETMIQAFRGVTTEEIQEAQTNIRQYVSEHSFDALLKKAL